MLTMLPEMSIFSIQQPKLVVCISVKVQKQGKMVCKAFNVDIALAIFYCYCLLTELNG